MIIKKIKLENYTSFLGISDEEEGERVKQDAYQKVH